MDSLISEFKNKLRERAVIGIFSKTTDPAFIECIGFSGFDFVIIDMEHGPATTERVQDLIRAAQISNILPIVRVKEKCLSLISEVLDIGAGGVQVPHINKVEDIKELIEVAKFSPLGNRGICKFVRAAKYSSMDKKDYFQKSNESVVIIQLEGVEGLKNIDEILKINGYDVLFIGPYDLSQSLGVPGEVNHPIIEEKMLEIVKKCKNKNIMFGNFVDTIEEARRWLKLGIKYFSFSVDVGIFYKSYTDIFKSLSNYR